MTYMDNLRQLQIFQNYEPHPIPTSFHDARVVMNCKEGCCDSALVEKDPKDLVSKDWRRSCGCLKTSHKLKQMLKNFPEPVVPPPPVSTPNVFCNFESHPSQVSCRDAAKFATKPVTCQHMATSQDGNWVSPHKPNETCEHRKAWCDTWRLMQQVLSLLQLMVTASALAVYYLIYCYMQLIYFTLQSAIYFHNADPSMKVTIAVVSITSIIIGINAIIRVERIMGF